MLMVTPPQFRRHAPPPPPGSHHPPPAHHPAAIAAAHGLPPLPPGSMSRTLQYKKITKPLLERKRRARINRCLDELKELMVGAFEAEGENVAKLEKADILELTVRHLHKLHEAGRLSSPPPATPADAVAHATRFQAGFSRCAAEAVRYLLTAPGLDAELGRRLVRHLAARCLTPAHAPSPPPAPSAAAAATSPASPLSIRVASPAPSASSSACSSAGSPPPSPATSTASSSATSAGLLMAAPALQPAEGDGDGDAGPVWRPW